jgi:hypothetical protein
MTATASFVNIDLVFFMTVLLLRNTIINDKWAGCPAHYSFYILSPFKARPFFLRISFFDRHYMELFSAAPIPVTLLSEAAVAVHGPLIMQSDREPQPTGTQPDRRGSYI